MKRLKSAFWSMLVILCFFPGTGCQSSKNNPPQESIETEKKIASVPQKTSTDDSTKKTAETKEKSIASTSNPGTDKDKNLPSVRKENFPESRSSSKPPETTGQPANKDIPKNAQPATDKPVTKKPDPITTPVASRPVAPVDKISSAPISTVAKGNYFWHGTYHTMPHDRNCRDTKWHAYLNAKPGDGGNPDIYSAVDVLPEEVDVSSYPKEFQDTYNNVIRGECNNCHTAARCLHRRYTPRQWKSALVLLQARYNLTNERVVELYKFFVYHEEQMIKQEE